MVWDDEDEYEPSAPLYRYPRARTPLWSRIARWVSTWAWVVAFWRDERGGPLG